jgi:light-independent protochlorophyllide reductase subunit L
VIRRSRLKKSTLFERAYSPEPKAVQQKYMRLAGSLWLGTDPLNAVSMNDRDSLELPDLD